MLPTGTRKSALLALNWDDIGLERGVIGIHKALWEAGEPSASSGTPRTRQADAVLRWRRMPLPGSRRKAWIRERQLASGRTWNADDLVFHAASGGLWRPSRATAVVGHVVRKDGLKTGLHNRRHTHAVLLMQAQVPITG